MLYEITLPRKKSLIADRTSVCDTCEHWLAKVKAYETIGAAVRVSKWNPITRDYTAFYATPHSLI